MKKLAKNGVLLAAKAAPAVTPEMATNTVSLAVGGAAGSGQEVAINGVSLQVRTPPSPAAPRECAARSESPASPLPLPAATSQTSSEVQTVAETVAAACARPSPEPADVETGPAVAVCERAAAAKPFQALLEVEHFVWPEECARLACVASDQLDGLAEQIAEEARAGRKIVGIASCRRGDGCTTLVLCIAPRLAAMGWNVLLVDSDFHNPVLARRLGLLPEAGWEEVLAGHLPLEEVIVESVEDRLALLPLKEPSPGRSYELGGSPDPSVSLRQAAGHYELLLVDLGRLHRHDSSGGNLPLPDGKWLDSLMLVHNERSTSQEDLTRNRQRVHAMGIHEMGIVENHA